MEQILLLFIINMHTWIHTIQKLSHKNSHEQNIIIIIINIHT